MSKSSTGDDSNDAHLFENISSEEWWWVGENGVNFCGTENFHPKNYYDFVISSWKWTLTLITMSNEFATAVSFCGSSLKLLSYVWLIKTHKITLP